MEFIPVNKYLCRIIDQYANVNLNQMITHMPKTRTGKQFIIKHGLTLMDIVIKANQQGYKGFTIPIIYDQAIREINLLEQNSNININKFLNRLVYQIKDDKRDLYNCDFLSLDNIFDLIDITANN
jgi:hypothetical protein